MGCTECNHTGFRGRVALSESITITDELKRLIHDDVSEAELSKAAFKNRDSIQSSSTDLLINGITSFEELLRLQTHYDVDV